MAHWKKPCQRYLHLIWSEQYVHRIYHKGSACVSYSQVIKVKAFIDSRPQVRPRLFCWKPDRQIQASFSSFRVILVNVCWFPHEMSILFVTVPLLLEGKSGGQPSATKELEPTKAEAKVVGKDSCSLNSFVVPCWFGNHRKWLLTRWLDPK